MLDFDILTVLVLILVYSIALFFLFLKEKRTKEYIFFYIVFCIYLSFVIKYTQFPITFDKDFKESLGNNVLAHINILPFNHFALMTFLYNLLLCIPFGFLYPLVNNVNIKKQIITSIIFCIILESAQLMVALSIGFTFRYIDINDIIANFAGSIIGYIFYRIFLKLYKSYILKCNVKLNKFLNYIYER